MVPHQSAKPESFVKTSPISVDKVTAVLLNWARPYHLPEIISKLCSQPAVGEILVWDNSGCLPDLPGCRVLRSEKNVCTLGRFLAAQQARHDVVYTQDDDLCVGNVQELLEAFCGLSDGTIFPTGANSGLSSSDTVGIPRVVANLADDGSSWHWTFWQKSHNPWVELGFGSVFPKSMAFSVNNWPFERELLERKADKVFTILNDWEAIRADGTVLTRLFWNNRESGRDKNALSLRADHRTLTQEAVSLAKQWKQEQRFAG